MKIIPISGEIGWEVWPGQIRTALAEANGEDVEIQISSPGGYVYDGLEIFNLIRNYKGNTTARIIGMAASMASYIPLAADKVVAESNAIFMIHNARAYSGGDQNAHTKIAKILTGLSNLLAQEYTSKTGKDKKKIKSMMDEETYLYGSEMLDAGFVDEIVEVGESEQEVARDDLVIEAMLKVEAVTEKLKENPEKVQNIDKIAASIFMSAKTDTPKPAIPVIKNQIMEKNMTFEEFLAKFPEEAKRITAWLESSEKEKNQALALVDVLSLAPLAKTEYEQAITTATAEAKTELDKDKTSEADARYIATIIGSEAYQGNKAVIETGIDTFAGKNDMKNFRTVVAMADQNAEMIKSLKIKGNQPDATGAEEHDLEGNTSVKSPKVQATVSTLKTQLNL